MVIIHEAPLVSIRSKRCEDTPLTQNRTPASRAVATVRVPPLAELRGLPRPLTYAMDFYRRPEGGRGKAGGGLIERVRGLSDGANGRDARATFDMSKLSKGPEAPDYSFTIVNRAPRPTVQERFTLP